MMQPIRRLAMNDRDREYRILNDELDSKQAIYREMFRILLMHLRAQAARPWYLRLVDRSSLHEIQLLHNLPISMFDEKFVEHDIWFLNNQAKDYFDLKDSRIPPLHELQVSLISRLFALVPHDLRRQLTWSGPSFL